MKEPSTFKNEEIPPTSPLADLPSQTLARVVADLQTTRPAPGVWRFLSAAVLFFAALAAAYEHSLNDPLFYVFSVLAGIFFTASAVTTHDAIHHTLTGLKWFDEISARIVTWCVFWPHGVYSELHKLHHKMNGTDLRDPERVTFSEDEYESAGALKKFYIRNQLWVSVFVSGGIGMIIGHLARSLPFLSHSRALKRELLIDTAAILAINGTLYTLAAKNGDLLKAVVLYVLVERIGGGLLQFRSHIEHYGLSGKRGNYFATQLHACRNIETNRSMIWIFNGLNYHSIHHAFPKVPFYHLEEAHRRMTRLLETEGAQGMPQHKGYLRTYFSLAKRMQLINKSPTQSPQIG
ncbi:MAG: hypothetical protein RIR26_2290 [Pseudomonadota bacterium]